MIRRTFIGRIGGDGQGNRNLLSILDSGYAIAVLLNGTVRFDVRAADSAEGWLEVFIQTRHSFPVSQRLTGHVEIRLEKPSPPRQPGAPWRW